MNLLGAANYDPVGGAVSKVTTSLIAMTAFDTTNLRIAFTIPSHGMVTVKMTCVHHGSTTTAQVFLGCLEGATLRGRAPVTANLLGTAVATTRTKLEASFTLTGLTPGAVNWDAAYGVEIVSSAGGAIKYGGPNNTTTDDAFGGFNFEIWDPRPIPTATPGAAGGLFIAGTNAATAITTGLTTTFTGNLTGSVASVTGAVGSVTGSVGSVTGAVGSVTGLTAATVHADLDDIQSRLPAALSGDGFMKADLKSIEDELTSGNNATLRLKKLDIHNTTNSEQAVHIKESGTGGVGVWIESLNTSGIAALLDGNIASMYMFSNRDTIIAEHGGAGTGDYHGIKFINDSSDGGKSISATSDIALPSGDLDDQLQAIDNYIDTEVSAIKAKTDQLTFTVANQVDANALSGGGGGLDAAGVRAAVGLASANLDTQLDALPTAAENATATWASGTRTLTSFGTLVADIWANATRTLTAISDSAGVTTLLSRIASALNITSGKVESNVKQINDTDITGDGSGTPWGPA
jgi:hypothetical protein